jgi:hypothetical protein
MVGADALNELLQSRPIHRRAGEPAVIISPTQADPAFLPLAVDEGLGGFPLRLQRIELLLEPLLGRLARSPAPNGAPESHFGIGLSIARRNVEAMGGTVEAENRTPHGLTRKAMVAQRVIAASIAKPSIRS